MQSQTLKTYNLYCDESCHIEHDHKQYMLLGYIQVPFHQLKFYKEEIQQLRLKHGYQPEIKWSKVSHGQAAFFNELTDLFFNTQLTYRAIVIDKATIQQLDPNQDFDDFYYKMYYQLIYHKLDMEASYNIYLDIKDTLSRRKVRDLHDVLQLKYSTIRTIQSIRSHESSLLQLADFFTGALNYKLNEPEGQVIAKRNILERIEQACGHPLDCSTDKSHDKFNLFFIKFKPRAF
jgi:hypothetical protein